MYDFNHPRWDQEKTHQMFYLMYPAEFIIYTENPELFRKFELISLADYDLSERATQLLVDSLFALNALQQLEEIPHEKYLAIEALGSEALNQRGPSQITGENLISFNELESFLTEQKIEEPQVIEAVTSYVDVINNMLRNIKIRSESIAQSALNQNGNGIIIANDVHKAVIEDELMKSCINPNRNQGGTYIIF